MTAAILTGQYALSAEHTRIAEIIHDYDPTLELAWVPPENRELNESHPFAVIHRPLGSEPYIVMRLTESEVNHKVLARLWAADSKNGNILDTIEAEEAARRAVELKKQMEEAEQRKEFAAWAIKAPVGAKHNGLRFE